MGKTQLTKSEPKSKALLLPDVAGSGDCDLRKEQALLSTLLAEAIDTGQVREAVLLLEVSNRLKKTAIKLEAKPTVTKAKLADLQERFLTEVVRQLPELDLGPLIADLDNQLEGLRP